MSGAANPVADSDIAARGRAPRLRADTLADGVMILLVMMVVQRLFGFARGVLFCRWLEPESFGQWGLIFSFLLLAAPLAVLGLPGSFGRYLEHYRQRGQLRMFLRRTTLWTIVLSAASVGAIGCTLPWFSQLVFGRDDLTLLMALTAACLATVIVHHFLESLFLALRMNRVVSGMQFCQSVGFAVIGIGLLWAWELSAASIVIAYAAASIISACGSLWWLRGLFDSELENSELENAVPGEPLAEPAPRRAFWARLLPFALWVWMANVLANLFAVVDRYMIVHFSGLDPREALAQVGHYQSSLIVPLLLVSVSDLIGAMLTPHLSHDWEAGRRELVSQRLNLAIKLVSLAMLLGAVAVLAIAPVMFGVLLEGKYSGGFDVLPWTLAYCTLFGIAMVANNYLWCAEKARLCSLALIVGLGVNIGLNLVLLPRLGLIGAVLGTVAANLCVLVLIFTFSRLAGMRFETGTLVLATTPLTIGLGMIPAAATLVGLGLLCLCTERILTRRDKLLLAGVAANYLQRLQRFHRTPRPSAEPGARAAYS